MKKRLDSNAITNELKGASLFFRHPGHEKTPRHPNAQTPGTRGVQAPRHPEVPTPRPPGTQTPEAAGPSAATGYDLGQRAEERQTLRLTEREFRRLNRLQDQLSIVLDVRKVDKNDIMRCAIQRLFEDFDAG